jgi:uncharacterized repeat protein (TIGR03803 family)
MRGQSEFRNSIWFTISFATAVALLVAGTAWAQNAVPPTARQAAASPAFAAKLHPATRPGMKKSRTAASCRDTFENRPSPSCSDRPSPQYDWIDPQYTWIYDNGPVNGNVTAYPIFSGNVVSDTYYSGSYTGWFNFYIWKSPGDVLSSVDWSITNAPNGGYVYASGTSTWPGDAFISTNQYGYDIDIVSMLVGGLNPPPGGPYWINLFNAVSGLGVYWDQNSGEGCRGYGCPSQAYASGVGTIPSEAFDIGQDGQSPPPCFQSGGNLQIIHDFTGQDGSSPSGVISNQAGNLYGTTSGGGVNGAGLAYELSSKGQGWVFDPLYSFLGGSSGSGPSPVILGPDEALYGTAGGGLPNCEYGDYCGLVYSLRPAPTACLTSLCGWTENTLYQFADGASAGGIAAFDQAGNLYGFSGQGGGAYGGGAVFQLTPSPGGWTEKILHNFTGGNDGGWTSSLLVGNDGNLYGTTIAGGGGYNEGVVFQLVPSGAFWTENVIHAFDYRDGSWLPYDLIQDSLGNLYGVASGIPDQYRSRWFIIFKLSPSNGSWVFSELYQSQTWTPYAADGTSGLAIDAAGNLYLAITNYCNGHIQECSEDGIDTSWGLVVMISPDGNSSNLWYSHGVDFSPYGPLAVDANGNVYGATSDCGQYGQGTIWKVTH